MEIESTYVRDEKFAKEFISYHSYNRPSGIIYTVFCILAIVSGVINAFATNEYLAIISIAFGIYMLVLRVIRVKRNIKKFLERDKESNHGSFISIQILVTENLIILKASSNESMEYEMSCIEKAYRSKNYIYLLTKAKIAIAFDINNFSKGTPEELVEFISQRGIKIK